MEAALADLRAMSGPTERAADDKPAATGTEGAPHKKLKQNNGEPASGATLTFTETGQQQEAFRAWFAQQPEESLPDEVRAFANHALGKPGTATGAGATSSAGGDIETTKEDEPMRG